MVDLTLLFFDFVAAEILFGLGENDVLAKNWVVLLEAELVWGIHRVLLGIIGTNARLFRDEANEFALSITFLCHNLLYFITD